MINCAIIGCGNIAGLYDSPSGNFIRTHIKAYKYHKDCKVVALYDTNKKKLNEFNKIWGPIPTFTNLDEFFDNKRIDILSICTPTDTHEEIFIKACKKGVHNIWLEKPTSFSSESIERMIKKRKEYGVKVWVNYFRRYEEGFKKAKKGIKKLGPLVSVRAFYTKSLKHNGSHVVDLLLWFFGDKVEFISDSNRNSLDFDTPSFKLKFNYTKVEIIGLDHDDFELFELDILGKTGRIIVKDGGRDIEFYSVKDSNEYKGYKNLALEKKHSGTFNSFMSQGLINCIQNKEMPTLEDDLKIQNIIDLVLNN